MDVVLEPGSYVVAVSGGVDSMVLLDMLRRQPDLTLTVAHFDHGIRADSLEDRKLVHAIAQRYGLPFVYHEGQLGLGTSEATARTARYDFLHHVRRASGARAVITAHHQDDALETAIINLLRGSGRKGLTALNSRHDVVRPLLHLPKRDLIAYAYDQGLVWREDSTNQDMTYLRNYVRHKLLPRFDAAARQQLWQLIMQLRQTNQELDTLLVNCLHTQSVGGQLDRDWLTHVPHAVAREVMAAWLRAHSIRQFDSKTLERLVVAAKVAPPGSRIAVKSGVHMRIDRDYLALEGLER